MDVNVIQQLIASLGFPIVCVLALGWFVFRAWDNMREDMKQQIELVQKDSKEREDILHKQIDRFNDSLDNFNITLTKIDSRLEYLEKSMQKE